RFLQYVKRDGKRRRATWKLCGLHAIERRRPHTLSVCSTTAGRHACLAVSNPYSNSNTYSGPHPNANTYADPNSNTSAYDHHLRHCFLLLESSPWSSAKCNPYFDW